MLAAVRALRARGGRGRAELVLAEPVSRPRPFAAACSRCLAGVLVLWAALLVGLLAGGLPAGGSAYLALATVAPALAFVGVGALASQLAPTRRVALELAGAVARCVALRPARRRRHASSLGWLRWVTPFGWSEELRPSRDHARR